MKQPRLFFSYNLDGYIEASEYLKVNYKEGTVDINHLRGLQLIEFANDLKEKEEKKRAVKVAG